jgi:hypothetical protein
LKKSGEKGDVVRKVLFMAAVAAAAVFALSAVPLAGASGCQNCTPTNTLHVEHNAFLLMTIGIPTFDLVVNVNCTGGVDGLKTVIINASQQANQSANGVGTLFGNGESTVNCDGTWHKLDISVIGSTPWNLGLAHVTAELVPPNTNPLGPDLGVADVEDVMITN